jgi:hypothetical protein
MADLPSIVQVTITAETRTPSARGFGTPLLLAFHSFWAEQVRAFSSIDELETAGVPTTHPLRRQVASLFGQSPRPQQVKIGKRALAHTQTIEFTPTDTTEGLVYTIRVQPPAAPAVTVTYTNGPAETVATIVTALQGLIDAIAGITATDNITEVSVAVDTPGDLFGYSQINRELQIENVTADPGVAADIVASELADPDWYALFLDSNGSAEIQAAAADIEARIKIFGGQSPDSDVSADVASNLFELLQTAAYARTFGLYSGEVAASYAATAWGGVALPRDPGSITWAFKELAGVPADPLNTTEMNNIIGLSGNHYTRTAGLNHTFDGRMFNGQFIDVQRTIDAITARIQERVFGLLFNSPKVPFTDPGIAQIRSAVAAVLLDFVNSGALARDPFPTVTVPLAADVSAPNKANRILPDVDFQATLAGAIHSVTIAGRLLL